MTIENGQWTIEVSLRDDFDFVCSADTLIVNYQLSIVNNELPGYEKEIALLREMEIK